MTFRKNINPLKHMFFLYIFFPGFSLFAENILNDGISNGVFWRDWCVFSFITLFSYAIFVILSWAYYAVKGCNRADLYIVFSGTSFLSFGLWLLLLFSGIFLDSNRTMGIYWLSACIILGLFYAMFSFFVFRRDKVKKDVLDINSTLDFSRMVYNINNSNLKIEGSRYQGFIVLGGAIGLALSNINLTIFEQMMIFKYLPNNIIVLFGILFFIDFFINITTSAFYESYLINRESKKRGRIMRIVDDLSV